LETFDKGNDSFGLEIEAWTTSKSILPKTSLERIHTPPMIAVAPINWDMLNLSERNKKAKQTVRIGELHLNEVALEGPITLMAT
jgi:hypothetical protein